MAVMNAPFDRNQIPKPPRFKTKHFKLQEVVCKSTGEPALIRPDQFDSELYERPKGHAQAEAAEAKRIAAEAAAKAKELEAAAREEKKAEEAAKKAAAQADGDPGGDGGGSGGE